MRSSPTQTNFYGGNKHEEDHSTVLAMVMAGHCAPPLCGYNYVQSTAMIKTLHRMTVTVPWSWSVKTENDACSKMVINAATTNVNGSGIEYLTLPRPRLLLATSSRLPSLWLLTTLLQVRLPMISLLLRTSYDLTAKEFTNFGLNCGQINKSASNDATYYVDTKGTVYADSTTYGTGNPVKALVDGSVETVYAVVRPPLRVKPTRFWITSTI